MDASKQLQNSAQFKKWKEAIHGVVAVQPHSAGYLWPKQTQTPAHFAYDSIVTSFPAAHNNETKYRIPTPTPFPQAQNPVQFWTVWSTEDNP